MYLSKLILVNYKSCKKIEIDFKNNSPNILVGINDAGKTTILKSIGLLLGEKFTFNYLNTDSFHSDISNTILKSKELNKLLDKYSLPYVEYSDKKSLFFAKFRIESDEIDEENNNISNQLLWCLENHDNEFWLCKEFNENKFEENLLLLIHDSKKSNEELWHLASNNLDKKIKEYKVSNEDIENKNKVGRYKKIEKIRAIYSKCNLKTIWSNYNKSFKTDKSLFPKYRYLDWNLNLNDLTNLVSDSMISIVDKYKQEALKAIEDYSISAEFEINEDLKKFKDDLFKDLPNIQEINAKFKLMVSENIQDILIKKDNSDNFVHIDSQGEGIKRRIWFSFIKWNALKSISNSNTNNEFIWCFDEPETHLYPASQREFFEIINNLTLNKVQTVLSTHSTIFTDKSKLNSISNVKLENKYTCLSTCESIEEIFQSLQLRNSDFLFFDKFLCVEGDTEEVIIPYLYKLQYHKTLDENNIKLIKLNSKSKKNDNHKILDQLIKDFRKPKNCIIYILDNDSTFDDKTLINNPSIKLLGKQDIEDSIINEVWLNIASNETKINNIITIAELEDLKSKIPNNIAIKSEQKFYNQLQIFLRRKKEKIDGISINYNLLPSKGAHSGEMIIKYLTKLDQIDSNILEAFKIINKY